MSTVPASVVALTLLAVAGALPVLCLVGAEWVSFPLAPLAGAVVASVAATAFLGVGGTFMGWFVAIGVAAGMAVCLLWAARPDRRPWAARSRPDPGSVPGHRMAGAVGFAAVLASCAWSLRALATPTVGFDARALWLMRAGWFLQPHHQLLVNMRIPGLLLNQSAYPPMVSASTAVAWSVTGDQTMRLGVVVVSVLNVCALMTAAFAVVECGRRISCLRVTAPAPPVAPGRQLGARGWWIPMVVGVAAAVLLVFVAFGVTEPFMTNGYADPIWSLAAVGAVAYGLQLPEGRSDGGVAAVLVVVAGLSKNEGLATAVALVALIGVRSWHRRASGGNRRGWERPVVVAGCELIVLAAWPVTVRLLHVRGLSSSYAPPGAMIDRARRTVEGMVPYLHVLTLAGLVSIIGGLLFSRVRRAGGVGNDGWVWAGLLSGLGAVAGALIVGSSPIEGWILTTVHRVTEYPVLVGWWIVATWTVVASAALVTGPSAGSTAPNGQPAIGSHPLVTDFSGDGTGPTPVPVSP